MVSVQRHVAVLRGMLDAGEAEAMWVRAERLGRRHGGALLLTDRRLLFSGLGALSQSQEAWPLALLAGVRLEGGVLHLTVLGKAEAFGGRADELGRLAAALGDRPAEGAPAGDVVERLERLQGLHAIGALDDGEFAAAKRRLLG